MSYLLTPSHTLVSYCGSYQGPNTPALFTFPAPNPCTDEWDTAAANNSYSFYASAEERHDCYDYQSEDHCYWCDLDEF